VDENVMEAKKSRRVQEIERTLQQYVITEKEKQRFSYTFNRSPIQLKDGSIYHGAWNVKGQKHGIGTMITKDGSKYEGLWDNDTIAGHGRYIDASGNFVYEGEFLNNKAHGKGSYTLADGMKYIGEWKDDIQEGEGEEIFPDGTRYKGTFKDGEKNGKGRAMFKDGSEYFGEFLNNCIHGKGTYKWTDGRVFAGDWVQNKMQGKGKFTWPDGKYYEGEYKNDKKDGFGKYCWNNSNYYEGIWFNGKQHGHGSIYNMKGEMVERGIWRYGKLIKKEFKKEKDSVSTNLEAVSVNKSSNNFMSVKSEGLNKENFYSAVSAHDDINTNDRREVEIIPDNKSDLFGEK